MREPVSFEVVPGDPTSPYIVHVAHSSIRIPDDVRPQLLLDDDALADELRLMTDARTDELAMLATKQVLPRPWLFVNRLYRLVVDPERLPNEDAELYAVGMGFVYSRTSGGLVLRNADDQDEHALLTQFFTPYAEALADLVDQRWRRPLRLGGLDVRPNIVEKLTDLFSTPAIPALIPRNKKLAFDVGRAFFMSKASEN